MQSDDDNLDDGQNDDASEVQDDDPLHELLRDVGLDDVLEGV